MRSLLAEGYWAWRVLVTPSSKSSTPFPSFRKVPSPRFLIPVGYGKSPKAQVAELGKHLRLLLQLVHQYSPDENVFEVKCGGVLSSSGNRSINALIQKAVLVSPGERLPGLDCGNCPDLDLVCINQLLESLLAGRDRTLDWRRDASQQH